MSPVEPTAVVPRKRQRPHVDTIADWRAQQSISLLWDRVYSLEERLQALEATTGDLVTATNAQEDALDVVAEHADEALAVAQATRTERQEIAEEVGVSTIPNYGAIVADTLATKFASPIVPAASVEAGKAQLTRAAAWAIYAVDPRMRLLAKTAGNQINGRSVDIILQGTDGSFADVTAEVNNGDGTYTITAIWVDKPPDANTRDSTRWIVPTAAIAAEAGPMTPVP